MRGILLGAMLGGLRAMINDAQELRELRIRVAEREERIDALRDRLNEAEEERRRLAEAHEHLRVGVTLFLSEVVQCPPAGGRYARAKLRNALVAAGKISDGKQDT